MLLLTLLLALLLQDTVVTRDQRVFYVAFRWVQEHWPLHVERGEHVADVPVTLFLDGQEVPEAAPPFKARIRVYNTAAHLVIGECVCACVCGSQCLLGGLGGVECRKLLGWWGGHQEASVTSALEDQCGGTAYAQRCWCLGLALWHTC